MIFKLLIIDGQYDFSHPQGSLFVPGANDDMERTCDLIDSQGEKLDDILGTFDLHHRVDVAHPPFWRNQHGDHPDPFTRILAADVAARKWVPALGDEVLYQRMLKYVQALDNGGRYPLTIWPVHCEIGTVGSTLYPRLAVSLAAWEQKFGANVTYFFKGLNPFTEHYSAVQAEVPDPLDPTTQINTSLIEAIMTADLVGMVGEASSHCYGNTVRDVVKAFVDPAQITKLCLLEDGTSPVSGFEQQHRQLFADMRNAGMPISNTKDFLGFTSVGGRP